MMKVINVIGGGLAGTEASLYLANHGYKVNLYEQKPIKMSPAHHSNSLGELVCSNSLKSKKLDNACGLLKEEMKYFSSIMMESASQSEVPAGNALSVDRDLFSNYITKKIEEHPNITLISEEVTTLKEGINIIATGPLTSDGLSKTLMDMLGQDHMYFYDAAAPIIDIEKMNIELPNNNKHMLVKSIRSKYNAVIHGISCKEGVVLVNLNQFVKKGEELVIRKDDESSCDAVIIGNVLEKEIIVVRKNKISFGYTGNLECKYNLKVGKNYLFKLNEFYNEQTIKIENLINIFNIIVIVKEIAYEQDYCLINYDYDSAYRYAESMLYYKLELERKSPLEKINDIKLLSYSEDDDKYYFEFIVNQVKSIGIYS